MTQPAQMDRRRFLQLGGAATGMMALGLGCEPAMPEQNVGAAEQELLFPVLRPKFVPLRVATHYETTRPGRQKASFHRSRSFVDDLWDQKLFANVDNPFVDVRDFTEPMTAHGHF